jgi:hypothetical protein
MFLLSLNFLRALAAPVKLIIRRRHRPHTPYTRRHPVFKRKLTEVAVDSFTEYLQERFEKLKQLDIDQDGHKDVDQVIEILGRCAVKVKETIDTTNFANIAAGLEQIFQGAAIIGSSLDKQKLTELGVEIVDASKKLTALGELTIQYVKERGDRGH